MPAAICAGSSTVPLNTRAVDRIAAVASATRNAASSLRVAEPTCTFSRPEVASSFTKDMDSTTIEVRALTNYAEMKACVALQHAIWGEDFTDIVPASILKVAQRIGGVVVGAFDPEA